MPLLRDGPAGAARAAADAPLVMDVIIVDDEPAARRTVRECCEREPDLRVVGEYGDSRAALEAIRAQPPQVLFLDIQMDSMTGMALARALDPQNLPLIVFVTAYDHYALEAFEVSAVDYLLKPFDEVRFRATRGARASPARGRGGLRPPGRAGLAPRAARAQRARACRCPAARAGRSGQPHAHARCLAGGGGGGGPQLRAPHHWARQSSMPAALCSRRRSRSRGSRCCASAAPAW